MPHSSLFSLTLGLPFALVPVFPLLISSDIIHNCVSKNVIVPRDYRNGNPISFLVIFFLQFQFLFRSLFHFFPLVVPVFLLTLELNWSMSVRRFFIEI